MHPKTIVSTSHQNFNNSTKIVVENSESVLSFVIRAISHTVTFTNIASVFKKPLKVTKNSTYNSIIN